MTHLVTLEHIIEVAYQKQRIDDLWRQFRYRDDGKRLLVLVTWKAKGYLNKYQIIICYDYILNKIQAFLVHPYISPAREIHVNGDMSLCLFDPWDYRYNRRFLIAEEIIPWIIEWTLCYEVFLETGIWHGKEAA